MPRPKVRPEERQRSTKVGHALVHSVAPLEVVAEAGLRGRASSCEYSEIDRRRHRGPRLEQHSSRLTASAPAVPASQPPGSPSSLASASEAISTPIIRTPAASCIGVDVAHGNAPLSLPGEQLLHSSASGQSYVGEAGHPSFLYFLRKTLRPFVGNISFTDSESQNVIHDGKSDQVAHLDSHDVSVEQMYFLLDSYFEATNGLLDLFTADEIDSLIAERTKLPSSGPSPTIKREDLAALDVALAIGAQTQPHPMRMTDPQLHVAFFSRASQIAFEGMLASPSLTTVRLFLLMTFYMLGVCNRNAASMYLGVAFKAAEVLGLQNSHPFRDTQLDDNSRLRITNSLTVVNVLASFILGRRQGIPMASVELSAFGMSEAAATENDQSTFSAILEGCLYIETIIQTLRTGHMLHVPTAECLLEQLRHWTENLRGPVRQFTFSQTAELNSEDRQALIGHVHLSCVYYFAVMLITRPFLIVYLMSRLRGKGPDHLIDDPDEATDVTIKNNKVSKLAQVCVSSATCMVKSLQKVKGSRFSFGNLCLLKAWIFGSGLVLGFSMFAGEPRKDIQEAFEGARDVLDDIAQISPQAKIYHSTLTDLAEAVGKYRQRVAAEIRKTVQHYLDPIPFLKVVAQGEVQQHPSSPFPLGDVTLVLGASDMPDLDDQGNLTMDVDLQINWADLDLHLVDNSLIPTTEPFEGLFCSVE
ncbi:Fc.00g057930.m01.CDS01 [Cosmosporella sp. VM-42]